MENKEILEKASAKTPIVGEMEKAKINTSCWIANVVAVVFAVALIIVEGALGHFSSMYAIGAVCYAWAAVFHFMQFFVAKRKLVGIMVGAILHTLGFAIMMVFYVLLATGVIPWTMN